MKIEHKVFQAEVKEFDERDLTVTHFISTEKQDRRRDILYAGKNERGKGMIMEGRPVVLLQHGFNTEVGSEPIAKPLWIKPGDYKNRKGIQAKTQFYPDELGKRLWKKTTEGYMPNWSVGWRPIEGKVEMKTDRAGAEIRHVYEWELMEYSLVAVPMQGDAQTMTDRGQEGIFFKMIPCICAQECNHDGGVCKDEKFGELIGYKSLDKKENEFEGAWEVKLYPNEHACRLEDPDKYVRVRRQNDKFGTGIHAIWGVQKGDKPVELQAIRFSKEKFTVAEARAWIKEHDYKCKLFEPASEKCERCGKKKVYKWFLNGGENCVLGNIVDHNVDPTKEGEYVHNGECEKGISEKWNKSLSKSFDLDIGDRPPAAWEYDLYKKFLKCEIKNIFSNGYEIPSPLLGTYLAGAKEVSKRFQILDTRSFTPAGDESPPSYEVIQLNSTKSDDFLVCGIQFYKDGNEQIPFVMKWVPNWAGLTLKIITSQAHNQFNKKLLEELHSWVKQNNFLKGERFALGGEFLEKTDDGWGDLILEDETKVIVMNSVNQVNKKKEEMKSRGMLFVGRPGTGKTKTGRAIMNSVEATFLWVSSRDLKYMSPNGVLSLAFSLAKDLSPSVLFLEDIDTWLGNYLVDLLKTELDGLKQNKGIVTILTSNTPEYLPDALLDRPGRFHHVLDFKLPDVKQRLSMLKLWTEGEVDWKLLDEISKKTEGFSGAHLKELIDFANIISEENGIEIGPAIQESLKRLMAQKRLIDDIKRNQKSYDLSSFVLEKKEVKTDYCSCDGEADDKGICKECNKPKEPKKETVIIIDDHEDMKTNLAKILDEFSKKVKEAFDPLKIMIDEMKVEAEKLKARIDALPIEPETGKKIDGGRVENPPERPKKIVVVNSKEDEKRTKEDRKRYLTEVGKNLSSQIVEAVKTVVPTMMKEELDRVRGRVK